MVIVHLTNGFGNNLFQYIAARLLAEFHKKDLIVVPPSKDYYAIKELEKVGVDFSKKQKTGNFVNVSEQNYRSAFSPEYSNFDFVLFGYFEDYTFFHKEVDLIKSWFPKIEKRKDNELVIHFRAGDRLFYKNEFDYKPKVESYINAIEKFDFSNLHIVTDMIEWDHLTKEKLEKMKFHVDVSPSARVPAQMSIDYFNSFVDGLAKYDPIVEKRTISEDFNFIRSFDNIMFQHGTLGWWASVLSEANKVGVYGPWRPWKGDSNKNLSSIGLEGWFKWR